MKLVFDEAALADLEGIYHWIAQDSGRTAKTVVDRIFASSEQLTRSPYMGRPGRDEGTREWVVPRLPYIVVYESMRRTTGRGRCGLPWRAGLGSEIEGAPVA